MRVGVGVREGVGLSVGVDVGASVGASVGVAVGMGVGPDNVVAELTLVYGEYRYFRPLLLYPRMRYP